MAMKVSSALDLIGDKLGVPASVRTTPMERQQMMQQMQQAAQQAAMAQQQQEGGEQPEIQQGAMA